MRVIMMVIKPDAIETQNITALIRLPFQQKPHSNLLCVFAMCTQPDSNRRFHLERAASWSDSGEG